MLRKFGFFIVIILLLSITCSCTRTVYQDREVVHYDTTYISKFSLDTVIQRDSVRVFQKGDTVKITETKYVYKVRERVDTSYVYTTDTLTRTETIEKEKVVRKKDWLSIIGALVVGAVVGFILKAMDKKE